MPHTSQSLGGASVAARLPEQASSSRRSTLTNFLLRLASLVALTLLLCLSVTGDVKADWVLTGLDIGDEDDDFDYVEHYHDEAGRHLVWYWGKDGTSFGHVFSPGNPDPDGTSSGPKGDLQSRIALAKQGGGNWVSEREFWDSPLGQRLTGKGKGPGPVINPGDDNAGGGLGDPSRGKEKLGGPLIIDKTGAIGSGKGGGFQFDAGSPADQLNKPGGPGGNPGGGGSDDDDDKGSDKPPPGSNYGPAELVDPLGPPIAKPAKKGTGKVTHGALGGPDTKGTGIALGGPDTKSRKGKSGDGFLPYLEQKSLKKNSGGTKGSERGVIAIIKPGERTGMGNSGSKGKSNATAPGLLETNTGFAAQGPSAMGATMGTRGGHR
jgi:hypothetical protein